MAKTGPEQVQLDLKEKIDRKERQLRQELRIGAEDASATEDELKALRAEDTALTNAELATEAARIKSGGGKPKQEVAVRLDKAGNVAESRIVNVNTNAPEGALPSTGRPELEGWVWGKEYDITNKAEADRHKLFRQAAMDVYGVQQGAGLGFLVQPQNQELFDGVMKVMKIMRKSDDYEDMTDSDIAVYASGVHADEVKEYMQRREVLETSGLSEKQMDEEQKILDMKVIAVLGSVPSEKAYERLVRMNRIEALAEMPVDMEAPL